MPQAVRVRTSAGWQDIALKGADGVLQVYEQPAQPTEPVPIGAVWIDTDAVPGTFSTNELAYVENVNQLSITATTNPGDLILAFPALSFDGMTTILIDLWIRAVSTAAPTRFGLADAGANVFGGAAAGGVQWDTSSVYPFVYCARRFVPPSGTRTYQWRAMRDSAGTSTAYSGADWPIWGRITRL